MCHSLMGVVWYEYCWVFLCVTPDGITSHHYNYCKSVSLSGLIVAFYI